MKSVERGITFLYTGIFLFLFSFNPYEYREDSKLFNPAIKPFYHGAASGGP
ncbi:uncharacterized protein METZ01_LOCUS56601 [marine metagenome]|uniref:Uncharacterized protein n=1 Tax=marine metagenome TaxID=408172 RepID=A0A381SMY8_9ZZZZ|tara:strand:- start:676 stop:828 length:153 start_codon:yes stop_codon:yes gene_type:complete